MSVTGSNDEVIKTVFVERAICGKPLEVLEPEADERNSTYMHIGCTPAAEPYERAGDDQEPT